MYKESLEPSDLFGFDYFSCLRSEYAKNDCRICIDLCPEEAMVFNRNRLSLDTDRCIGCCACMGSCPTQALQSEMFDAETFVASFLEEGGRVLSCQENVPCLAALGSESLATIAMGAKGGVACDLSSCESCELNKNGKVFEAIETSLQEAENFATVCGKPFIFEREVSPSESQSFRGEEADEKRRGLLKKLVTLGTVQREERREPTQEQLPPMQEQKSVPKRRESLKSVLRKSAESFEDGIKTARFSFVVGKKIDKMACTNCQECAMFCPTDALSILQDNTGIIFQLGKCIACGICNDICQPNAIEDEEFFDPVTFTFDRMNLLVKHELEICEECKVAFPYKGGEKICDRCRDFKNNFSDLFTMAKDM